MAIGAIIAAVAPPLIEAGFSWWGMNKQVAENQRAERLGLRLSQEDMANQERWAQKNWRAALKAAGLNEKAFLMSREKFEWEKDFAEMQYEDQKEQTRLKNMLGFTDRFLGMLNRNGQARQNATNNWKARM